MQQPPPIKNSLGEAMGALIILLLMLPLAAITVRGTVDILTKPIQCSPNGK